MQERVERKELSVGAVPSSENVADIGTKRLSVPTMKYLMLNLGVFDSETCSLVGQDEYEMKVSKENLRLIATSPNFKVSANLIRLLVASSLASADALSCGTALSAAMDMAWIDWSTMDGVGVNLFKFPFMQLYYLIQLLFMQLSFIFEYAQTWMHGFAYLTGWLCVITFAICLGCRIFLAEMLSTAHQVVCLCCLVISFSAWDITYWNGIVRRKSNTGRENVRNVLM